jgi:hypothetical protein
MVAEQTFQLIERPGAGPNARGKLPLIPVVFRPADIAEAWPALVDSGATVSVMPYALGLRLGAVWRDDIESMKLTGNLSGQSAQWIQLPVQVADFAPVVLAFLWSSSDNVPVLLGQTNFFQLFDVNFRGSKNCFSIRFAQD